jgi:DnaD/phage-associated family protein
VDMRNCLEIKATLVANEFIDRYMTAASGEYVKVYLYLLRHQGEDWDIGEIADALNHTESDVRRALGYWVRQGVLAEADAAAGRPGPGGGQEAVSPGDLSPGVQPESGDNGGISARGGGGNEAATAAGRERRKLYTPEQVSRLAGQEDFTQLLYISQKYMNKVFTPRECEVFAYLYDALGMSSELLEYLVEYCVQGGHYSIRYLESVALNWHEKGIVTVDMAKEYTSTFSKEGFAVMKAFGISDRRPGDSEQAMIRKWFREYGFTKDIVLEACGRTLKAIHKPSFSYADKILSDWKKGGVRVLADVGRMDEKRDGRKNDKGTGAVKPAKNQFHNFEQRGTNYDAMVLERLKERLEDKK